MDTAIKSFRENFLRRLQECEDQKLTVSGTTNKAKNKEKINATRILQGCFCAAWDDTCRHLKEDVKARIKKEIFLN